MENLCYGLTNTLSVIHAQTHRSLSLTGMLHVMTGFERVHYLHMDDVSQSIVISVT